MLAGHSNCWFDDFQSGREARPQPDERLFYGASSRDRQRPDELWAVFIEVLDGQR
jgi:hypothetical protein